MRAGITMRTTTMTLSSPTHIPTYLLTIPMNDLDIVITYINVASLMYIILALVMIDVLL